MLHGRGGPWAGCCADWDAPHGPGDDRRLRGALLLLGAGLERVAVAIAIVHRNQRSQPIRPRDGPSATAQAGSRPLNVGPRHPWAGREPRGASPDLWELATDRWRYPTVLWESL